MLESVEIVVTTSRADDDDARKVAAVWTGMKTRLSGVDVDTEVRSEELNFGVELLIY